MTKAFDFIKYLFRKWEFWPTYFGLAGVLFLGGIIYSLAAAFATGMIVVSVIVFMIIKPMMKSYKEFNRLREAEHDKLLQSLKANYES